MPPSPLAVARRRTCNQAGCEGRAEPGWTFCRHHRGFYPDPAQVRAAQAMLARGRSLSEAASAVGCFAGALDRALWSQLGRRHRPQF